MPTGVILDVAVLEALEPLMYRLLEAERIRDQRGLGTEADHTVTVHLCHLQRVRDALAWSPPEDVEDQS